MLVALARTFVLTCWVSTIVWADPPPNTGWRRVTSAHVFLSTDLSAADAIRAVEAVERTRAALVTAAFPGVQMQPAPLEVVVFANREAFERHFGRRVAGTFTPTGDLPLAVLFGRPDTWDQGDSPSPAQKSSVLKHEMLHYLAAYVFRRQPRWFGEGLAQFLESMEVSDDGRVTIGAVNLVALRKYQAFHTFNARALEKYGTYRAVDVADAFGWKGGDLTEFEGTIHGLYGVSWLLVHWLFNTHRGEFARFETLLAEGIDPDRAWKSAFGPTLLINIDEQLEQYSRQGKYGLFVFTLVEADKHPAITERTMQPAEVHTLLAQVALAGARAAPDAKPHLADARAELRAAVEADPGDLNALRLQMSLVPPGERLSLARTAIAAHPTNGLAWLAIAEAPAAGEELSAEREEAYRKAIELLPDRPVAKFGLAQLYVEMGRYQDALPLAVDAVEGAPWAPRYLDTLASALHGVGRCMEALAMEHRALAALPEWAAGGRSAGFGDRLKQYEQECGPPVALPKSSPSLEILRVATYILQHHAQQHSSPELLARATAALEATGARSSAQPAGTGSRAALNAALAGARERNPSLTDADLIRLGAGAMVASLGDASSLLSADAYAFSRRAQPDLGEIDCRIIEGRVLYLRNRALTSQTTTDAQAIPTVAAGDASRAVILDLRKNPGGLLDPAVQLANLFVESGEVLTVVGRSGSQRLTVPGGNARLERARVAVLVDGETAGAAEVVAGALQDHKRAVIVGETTAKIGDLVVVYELASGAFLKLVVAHLLRPSGVPISGRGISPDIEVAAQPDRETALLHDAACPGRTPSESVAGDAAVARAVAALSN